MLTAVAAMLAFIPITHSSFWGALAYVLIGGVGAGTVLTLLFLPALYAIWLKVEQPDGSSITRGNGQVSSSPILTTRWNFSSEIDHPKTGQSLPMSAQGRRFTSAETVILFRSR